MTNTIRRIILSPFSILYVLVIYIRNWLYEHEFFMVHHLGVPVISVGNITAGGTGKTPFTIALCNALINKYTHIVVLSRGYGRSSKGPLIVSLKGQILESVWQAGDEPYLIAKRCKNVSVVVAEKRFLGFELIRKQKPDLVILDDGFQHRSIFRDIDIVLNNGLDSMEKDALIPMGRLREPLSSLKRANFICNTKKFIVESRFPMFDCTKVEYSLEPQLPNDGACVLITGVANSDEVYARAKTIGLNITQHLSYKDHVDYRDVSLEISKELNIVTTAKDFDKLRSVFPARELFVLRQSYQLDRAFLLALEKRISDASQTCIKL